LKCNWNNYPSHRLYRSFQAGSQFLSLPSILSVRLLEALHRSHNAACVPAAHSPRPTPWPTRPCIILWTLPWYIPTSAAQLVPPTPSRNQGKPRRLSGVYTSALTHLIRVDRSPTCTVCQAGTAPNSAKTSCTPTATAGSSRQKRQIRCAPGFRSCPIPGNKKGLSEW